ncbi:MAG TPA: hypothetical protein VND45_12775 [Thermoanaerobaculia bacterium]|nr:hypothetical protein [Thermoanaerobaculia bacterium]
MIAYFFFDDFLLLPPLDFLLEDEDLEPPFFAAISAHHLSCRTGPPGRASWHNAPDRSGKLACVGDRGKDRGETGADDLRRI